MKANEEPGLSISVDHIVLYKPAGYGIGRILLSISDTNHFESLAGGRGKKEITVEYRSP